MDVTFEELVRQARKQKGLPLLEDEHVLLSLDPGHTTGWALFVGDQLAEAGEIDTSEMVLATHAVQKLFWDYGPNVIVLEDYRVYKWRAEHHIGSEMLTTRVIGCIETISVQHFIQDIYKQPANVAKNFCTDAKLRKWGLYKEGEKHARDAIRHGAYFLIFGPVQRKDKQRITVG